MKLERGCPTLALQTDSEFPPDYIDLTCQMIFYAKLSSSFSIPNAPGCPSAKNGVHLDVKSESL